MPEFKPDPTGKRRGIAFEQAYFEDGLDGASVERPLEAIETELKTLLASIGAFGVILAPGTSEGRAAFQLTFSVGQVDYRMVQVSLPLRSKPTKNRLATARKQALWQLLQYLKFQLQRRHFVPDEPIFLAHILTPPNEQGVRRTVAEIAATQYLLAPGVREEPEQ